MAQHILTGYSHMTLVWFLMVVPVLVSADQILVPDYMTIGVSSNTDFGGLSAESVDIAKSNITRLMADTNDNNTDFGVSAESVDIAKSNITGLRGEEQSVAD